MGPRVPLLLRGDGGHRPVRRRDGAQRRRSGTTTSSSCSSSRPTTSRGITSSRSTRPTRRWNCSSRARCRRVRAVQERHADRDEDGRVAPRHAEQLAGQGPGVVGRGAHPLARLRPHRRPAERRRAVEVRRCAGCDYSVGFEGPELSSSAPLTQVELPPATRTIRPSASPGHPRGRPPPARLRSRRPSPTASTTRPLWTNSRVVGFPDAAAAVHAWPGRSRSSRSTSRSTSAEEPGTRQPARPPAPRPWAGPGQMHAVQERPRRRVGRDAARREPPRLRHDVPPRLRAQRLPLPRQQRPGRTPTTSRTASRRYTIDRKPPYRHRPEVSELVILEWDSNGHNGGDLAFGPDGYLYHCLRRRHHRLRRQPPRPGPVAPATRR